MDLPILALVFHFKGMSDFDSGNSVNCVLSDVNLYETKREK